MATRILKVSAWALALANFWIFSRFTADDSFITWRYGRNLVDHGVWNYNPTTFDPTQAYSNPIFALISLIPAFSHINVVLFFKVLSIAVVAAFIFFFLRNRPAANLPLALFFALPATMIHIFGGLETFVFVILVFLLLKALHTSNNRLALGVTLVLFLTRPESWLLVVLVPLFLSIRKAPNKGIGLGLFAKYFLILALPLSAYFLLHISLFGQALPNTFYVKSGQFFAGANFILWLFPLLPLIATWFLGLRKLTVFAALFMGAIAFQYSTSLLSMDYAYRYAFHLLAPLLLFVIYLLSDPNSMQRMKDRLPTLSKGLGLAPALTVLLVASSAFGTLSGELQELATYYPNLLNAHGQIGQVVRESKKTQKIRAIAVGDAGLLPYVADLPNLDLGLLGTHIGATEGISKKLIDQYEVDFAVFRGVTSDQAKFGEALRARGLKFVCIVDFREGYELQIWSKVSSTALKNVCSQSRKTAEESQGTSFIKNVEIAPWLYWR